jgi:putative protease
MVAADRRHIKGTDDVLPRLTIRSGGVTFVPMRRPELLAPGGSFHAAYHAIEAGADGVYLGLRDFSARRAAANFDFDQLARIRGYAGERGRRVYVALNTVVRDDEIGRLAETLVRLEALAVDGLIVQDLGVAALAKRHFPSLPLHASTQMAVHNAAGLAELVRLGFRRVILARELTLEEIADLRRGRPDLELEVFVHGALCYSFSGVCLASWALTGRSGNRGDCAQICRGRFERTGVSPGPDEALSGTFFSCRDLFLGRDALELVRLGVDAFKIEGRMKSPEYAAATVRLYRAVIDEGESLAGGRYERLVRDAQLSFAREPTTGWLRSPSGSRLVDIRFPGHRGARLGAAAGVRREGSRSAWVRLTLEGDLSLRDGLALMSDDGTEQSAFSVQAIRKGGRDARFARVGDTVEVLLPDGAGAPIPGQELRQLSSRFLDLPEPKESSVRAFRTPVAVGVGIDGAAGSEATLAIAAGGIAGARFEARVSLERAAHPRPFLDVLRPLLAEGGGSAFVVSGVELANRTGLPDDLIFVPPSQLKRAKNLFYARLDEAARGAAADRAGRIARGPALPDLPAGVPLGTAELAAFADRASISPRGREPLPFARLEADGTIDAARLAACADFTVVPLPPIMIDTAPWSAALRRLAGAQPSARFAVGLANLSHAAVAGELADLGNTFFFADVHLYTANRWTAAFLAERVSRLLFAYRWIEDDPLAAGWESGAAVPVITVAPGFRAPLFASRGCFAKHVLNQGACPAGCPRDFRVDLRQGGRGFQVVVEDCVTYLFA